MSELSAAAFVALAFMFAYLGLKEQRRWKIYRSAILLGLSVNIRTQSVFFAPLLLATPLFPAQEKRLRWFLHCILVSIAFVLAISPTLVLNAIQFHSPLKTGYDFGSLTLVRSIFSFCSVTCREMQATSGGSCLCSRTCMTQPTSSARALSLFPPSSF